MNFLGEAEVAKLELEVLVNEHVLELDVAVGELCLGVKRVHAVANLGEEILDKVLIRDRPFLSDDIEEIHLAQFSRHIVDVTDGLVPVPVLGVDVVLVALDVARDLYFALTLDEVVCLQDVWVG